MSGENECAHSSYDLILDMLEKNVVVQLPPSKFPSRRSELSNEKVVKEVTLDSSSRLQLKDQKTEVMRDTGSELLLTQALQRRALALDLTNAATYATVQEYNDYLIRQLQATVPGGYKRVDVQQVLRADQEAFNRMSELLTEGLRRKPDGSLPMDEAFRRLLTDAKVAFSLLPLPARPVATGDDRGLAAATFWEVQGKGQAQVQVQGEQSAARAHRQNHGDEEWQAGVLQFQSTWRMSKRPQSRTVLRQGAACLRRTWMWLGPQHAGSREEQQLTHAR